MISTHYMHSMQIMQFLVFLVLALVVSTNAQEYVDTLSGGSWEIVVPKHGGGASDKSLGMQTVHAVLLPSGTVLLASGRS